jgi:hypothetical protein
MFSVSSLALHKENAQDEYSRCISLPRLFNLPSENIRHNIILNDDTTENKTILFIPKVECEAEISDDEIFPIPQVLCGTSFSALFSGILFGAGGAPILLLNTEQFIQVSQ